MRTVHVHNVVLDLVIVVIINHANKFVYNGAFTTARGTVKNDIGDFMIFVKE